MFLSGAQCMPRYIVRVPALRLEFQKNRYPLLLKGKLEEQAAVLADVPPALVGARVDVLGSEVRVA